MSSSKFTEEQIAYLQSNPNIVAVTPGIVSLSKEFKELIWQEMNKGKDIHNILEDHGIPCRILGETRIAGIKALIKRGVRNGGRFADAHTFAAETNGFMTPEKRIKQLELMLKYKDQEIEFLKKMVSLVQEE